MLGTALWFVVAFALLAGVLLDGAAAFARAGVQAAADHAVDGAMRDAIAGYQNALQTAMASATAGLASPQPFAGAPPSLDAYSAALASVPNPFSETFTAGGASGATFAVTATVTPTTIAPPACPQDGAASDGPDDVAWLQCNGFVQESRASLHVVVRVQDTGGNATFAQRDADVTLRLFAAPPYSAVVGSDDASGIASASGDATPAPHEGDLGGDTRSGASPQPSPGPWPAGGTLIHVQYQCLDGAGHCANAAPPDPDAGLQPNVRWSDGNRPQP